MTCSKVLLLLCTEVRHAVKDKICIKMYDKSLKVFANETKLVKICRKSQILIQGGCIFHRHSLIS